MNLWVLFSHPIMAKKAMTDDYHLVDLNAMSDNDVDYKKQGKSFFLSEGKILGNQPLSLSKEVYMQILINYRAMRLAKRYKTNKGLNSKFFPYITY